MAAAACSLALGAAGQSHWNVQMDNDLGFETDRWYSSGFRVGVLQRHGDHEREIGFLHEIFTPDVKGFRFGTIDRMPTARLLLTLARHDRSPEAWQTLEIDAGVRGRSAGGEDITRLIHRVVRARDIDWSRQDGNRADVQLVASRTQALARRLNMHFGASLGNQVSFVHLGMEARLGTPGASAPSSAVVRFASSPPPVGAAAMDCWSAFFAVNGRAVLRNEMLERGYGFFSDPPTRRRGVARAAVGYSRTWPGITLTAAVVHESKEFAQQSRGHTFGSISGYVDF